jgi:magnesium chelatase family protein
LREPLESRVINISRAARQVSYPSHFQLVAAMNPCPDGYLGSNISAKPCRCTPDQIARYRGKISGPLLDRIDLQITVPSVPTESLRGAPDGERSSTVRKRVMAASGRQHTRQQKANADLSSSEVDLHCGLDDNGETLLRQATARLGLSARAQHRIARVARTIADLAGSDAISVGHVAESIGYRRMES